MKQIKNFWNHFEKNNFVFLLLNEIPQDELVVHYQKLDQVLREYNNKLGFIITNGKSKSKLIITAYGNPYLFKDVELLVHHAPAIERWKITAFTQPDLNIEKYENGTDSPFIFHDITLTVSEMYFVPLESSETPNKFGIRIFIKNYFLIKRKPKLREAVSIVIEHLVGEKSFANEISFIDIAQIRKTTVALFDLYNLNSFLEDFHKVTKK